MRLTGKPVALILGTLTVFSFFASGCGQGGGCGEGGVLEKLDKPFSKDLMINRPAQIRMSQEAFNFLSLNYNSLIKMFLPGGLVFPVAEMDIDYKILEEEHILICKGGCEIKGNIKSFTFNMVEPDKITPKVVLDIAGKVTMDQDAWYLPKHCDVNVTVTNKVINATVTFKVDQTTGYLSFDLSGINIVLEKDDFNVSNCGALEVVDIIKGMFMETVNNLIQQQIKKLLDEQLGKIKYLKCDYYKKGCPSPYKCSDNDPAKGFCADDKGVYAAAPLGVVGKIDIGSLLASFAPGMTASLDLAVAAGQFDQPPQDKIVFAQGLSMSMVAGIEAKYNKCVPETVPPEEPKDGIPETGYMSNTSLCVPCDPDKPACPAGTQCIKQFRSCMKSDYTCPSLPFMVGIGVHEYFLNKAFWTAFNSGALCLSIGTNSVDMLSSGLFGLLIPEMSGVLVDEFSANGGSGSAPVILVLKPQKAPVVKLGSGVTAFDGDNALLIKPVMTVEIKDLSIDFYVFIFERYTRMFTLTTDIILPVGLDVVPSKEVSGAMALLPVLDDLFGALTNIRAENTEMMGTNPEEIENIFANKLKDIVTPLLSGGLGNLFKPIDLPAIQGFNLDIMGIKGDMMYKPNIPEDCSERDLKVVVDNFNKDKNGKWAWKDLIAPTCENQFLGIFAKIGIAPAGQKVAMTVASIDSVDYEKDESNLLKPVVTVGLGYSEGYEYSYRIDGAPWRMFRPAVSLKIDDPALRSQGRHAIDIRSRYAADPASTDLKGVSLDVVIDSTPPKIRIDKEDLSGLVVSAADWVTAKEAISISYRVNEGNWISIANGTKISGDILKSGRVEVRAVDEAGRENVAVITKGLSDAPDISDGTSNDLNGSSQTLSSGDCGCSTVDVEGGDSGTWLLIGMFFGLAMLLRRRADG